MLRSTPGPLEVSGVPQIRRSAHQKVRTLKVIWTVRFDGELRDSRGAVEGGVVDKNPRPTKVKTNAMGKSASGSISLGAKTRFRVAASNIPFPPLVDALRCPCGR